VTAKRSPGSPGRPARSARTPGGGRSGADPRRARTATDPARSVSQRARTAADPARSASRPASARRAAATGAAKRTRAPQPGRFTGRATTLGLILVTLLLAYAYPMRIYLTQQAQIAALESRQDAQRARIQEKKTQVAKWNDKDYIIAMAHKRLQMVLPGDKAYVTGPAAGAADPPADPNAGQAINTGPWYDKLWSSVQAADKPGTAP
jgi:cell division protein FtsB